MTTENPETNLPQTSQDARPIFFFFLPFQLSLLGNRQFLVEAFKHFKEINNSGELHHLKRYLSGFVLLLLGRLLIWYRNEGDTLQVAAYFEELALSAFFFFGVTTFVLLSFIVARMK